MTVTNRFVLNFNSGTGRTVRIGIPRAYTEKTPANVESTMNEMISGGIIATRNGSPETISGADLVTIERRVIVPAA